MKDLSSAVGFAAKLKPEIRLAQAISEFNASLSNKNQRARFKNLQSQSPPSSDDIIRLTEEINRDGARAHRSWRPYGTRLVAILERMRQFAPIGDVLVGGSQNLIACGVWAVVRLSLETSLSFLSYFENVTNMMLRLGQSLSLHKDFAMLFPRCSTLQSYMCEYTIVMVNICKKIVHDCTKSALSQLAASFTSTFDAVFKSMESDLTTWAQLIEKRATILLAKADLQSHSSVLERFNRLQVTMSRESATQQKDTRKHQLLASLCPDQGEFSLIWRRERKKGTSSWMYETDAYRSWLSSKAGSVLWLKGNLGSGKTVTMASAVAHLTLAAPSMDPQGAVTVSYFFCQSGNPKTLSASMLLGSIAGQALQSPALEPSLMSFLKQLEKAPYVHAMPEEYIDVLLKATPSNWRGIFVLDGLDEMPQEEVRDIFEQLHRLREHQWVSLLCSSRPTSACYSMAKSNLDEIRTLSMETAERSEEIRAYLAAEISRWNTVRPLTTELKRLVEEQLLAGCQGMLLWLSLQMEDICPRYTQELRSDAEILDILGNLPKDLPGAFEKALSRMRDGKYGSKLFKLVASAEPPLSMDELRVASNVEPGNTNWDNSTLSRSGKALISAYGGSLLDIDEEDFRVRFIHYSVLLHLTTPSSDVKTCAFHFDLEDAERTLGAVCVTYLNYSVFETRVSTAQKVSLGQVPQATAGSVMSLEASRKAFSLLAKHRRPRDPKVDLEGLSYKLQSEKWRVRDVAHLFLDYARNKWLSSTRNIWSDDQNELLPLWRNLITHPIVSDSLPWDSVSEAAAWALSNGHATLFQHYLHSDDLGHLRDVLAATEWAVSSGVSNIQIKGEGFGWLLPLYLAHSLYKAPILQAFIHLGCQPFKPTTAKCPSPNLSKQALQAGVEVYITSAFEMGENETSILLLADFLDDPNVVFKDGSAILQHAIARGFEPMAFKLLSKGANPDGGRATTLGSPLQLSIKHGLIRLVQRLVESGASITVTMDDETPPLFFALEKSNFDLFHALLLRDPSLSIMEYGPKLETASHRLCTRQAYDDLGFAEAAMGVLMEHSTTVNLRNKAGETPLLLAVKMKMFRFTEILLKNEADPNIGDCVGARPLHYAQDTETVKRLLRLGADPNATTVHAHVTPLMVAAYQGQVHLVEALLDGGASLDLCLSSNLSAEEVMVFGWQNGPGVKLKSELGATAFHICCWRLEDLVKDYTQKFPGYPDPMSKVPQSCSDNRRLRSHTPKSSGNPDPMFKAPQSWSNNRRLRSHTPKSSDYPDPIFKVPQLWSNNRALRSQLISMLGMFLRRGVGSQARSSDILAKLEDALIRGKKKGYRSLEIDRALGLIAVARAAAETGAIGGGSECREAVLCEED